MSSDAGFTARLNRLFETVRSDDGKPFTNAEIVARMVTSGYQVTAGYISQLRSGLRRRPSITHIEGLARAFGVSASYFFEETIPSDGHAGVDGPISTIVDADVKLMAMRTAQLSDEGRRQALLLVDKIRQREAGQQ
jgi:transcriptional regulator with XRE-family HTH domain